ncbi:MAG: dipeptide epimerase [Oscillospiraceae bacterium]|nr:dipeptide epimerase [Oscillospiraceae bacterium]
MKITDIQFRKMTFTFNEPFKIAFAVIEGYDTLVLKIETDEGIAGYGEAAPLAYVTGDSLDTALTIGKEYREMLLGKDPLAISQIHAIMDRAYTGNTSIKAAIDIACYDIAAKKMGVPLWKYLGGSDPTLVTDVTLSIDTPQKMAAKAREWVNAGFTEIKVKLGEDIKTDLARMKAIRAEVGPEITLRIDANQGWNAKDSIRIAAALEELDIDLIEQPVPDWNLEGLRQIRDASRIPIAADESCHSPMDALKLTACVDGMNIKLMKCGGIYNALKINAVAEAAGLFCMIGCMGESKIANAAGMHLAAATPNIQKIDLDVTFFAQGAQVSGGFESVGGKCRLSDKPGLGIEIDDF